MTAENIARVVADIRAARVQVPRQLLDDNEVVTLSHMQAHSASNTVVDATAIYENLAENPRAIPLYEHTIAPPWSMASICYENQHGNVIVMASVAADRRRIESMEDSFGLGRTRWETAEPVDWDRVRWVMTTFFFMGGWSTTVNARVPTQGPLFAMQYAIDDDGQPLDIHWIDMLARGTGHAAPPEWDMAMLVHLRVLDFMNARNVDLVDAPVRNRAEARRIQRTGIQVKTLRVFPVGRSRQQTSRPSGAGVPLTTVVGHWAHYGDCCPGRHTPRGLLFGKLSGRYWIPQHARGREDLGEHRNDYEIVVP